MSTSLRPWLGPALLMSLALPLSGCAPGDGSQGVVSGQIGRYHDQGVSFSVPWIRDGTGPADPDVYWEVRGGIASTEAVTLSPLADAGDGYRETMALTRVDLGSETDPGAFRDQQLPALLKDLPPDEPPTTGEDGFAPWVRFVKTVEGRRILHLAWFFTRPAGEGRPAQGFVLLGSTPEGPEAAAHEARFRQIASSFRLGPPPTGFERLDEVIADLLERMPGPPVREAGVAAPAPGGSAPAGGPAR